MGLVDGIIVGDTDCNTIDVGLMIGSWDGLGVDLWMVLDIKCAILVDRYILEDLVAASG